MSSLLGVITIFLCVLSQLGVGSAWDAGRATSLGERPAPPPCVCRLGSRPSALSSDERCTPGISRTSDRPRWLRAQPGPLLGGHGCIVCRLPTTIPQTPPAFPHPGETGLRRTGGRDNHWSIKSVGRTRPQNILLMEPVSTSSCLVWQPTRGRPTRPLSREPNNPYLTEREVRVLKSADLPGCKVYSP